MENQSPKPSREDRFFGLYVKYEPDLRAYARSLLRDWHEVDDILQKASVVMWKKFDVLEDDEGFRPWGKVIVRNHILNESRRRSREFLVIDSELLDILLNESDQMEDEVASEEMTALEVCLKKLSETNQNLVMAPYSDRGYVVQLAKQTGQSLNSLYKKLGRLRGKLADCITEQMRGKQFAP